MCIRNDCLCHFEGGTTEKSHYDKQMGKKIVENQDVIPPRYSSLGMTAYVISREQRDREIPLRRAKALKNT